MAHREYDQSNASIKENVSTYHAVCSKYILFASLSLEMSCSKEVLRVLL